MRTSLLIAVGIGLGVALGIGAAAGCGNSDSHAPAVAPSANVTPSSGSAASAEIGDAMVPLSRVDGSTFIEILEVRADRGGRLLYCTGVRGLQVVDASDPKNMKVTAELRSSKFSHDRFARCQHVAIDGDTVYFTNRGDMIQKTPFITGYDLSTSPPKEIVNYTAVGVTIEGIAAKDGLLYVAMHERGLAVMKREGNTLRELGVSGGFKAAWSVALSGTHAFVADTTGSVGVVDVSDPSKPTHVASFRTGGSAQSIDINGNHAFIAAGARGLVIANIKDPLKPTVVGEINTGGSALQVSVDGSRAYVANWGDARVYDVSDPKSPALIAAEVVKTEEPGSRVLGMSGVGGIAFVGEWTGMYAFRIGNQRAPHVTSDHARVAFNRTKSGQTAAIKVAINNEGNAPLVITKVTTAGAGFSVETIAETVAPGSFVFANVSFSPTSDAPSAGELLVASNDPDDALSIPLIGNSRGLGVGDKAPEVSLKLIDGGQWRLADQRGKIVVLAYFATF